MSDDLCSIRMHASLAGDHVSGAEQLVGTGQLQRQAQLFLQRALAHARGAPDRVHITIDPVQASELVYGRLPRIVTRTFADRQSAQQHAVELLAAAGVAQSVAATTIKRIADGAAPGGRVMRGAMLIDSRSGARLEPDAARGVRVSRLGIDPKVAQRLHEALKEAGCETQRVSEALMLAAKVMTAPDVLAELCWSDDPGYLTGYVASAQTYTRLSPLKEDGDSCGGRAFFVRPGGDIRALSRYLEERPFLVDDVAGAITPTEHE